MHCQSWYAGPTRDNVRKSFGVVENNTCLDLSRNCAHNTVSVIKFTKQKWELMTKPLGFAGSFLSQVNTYQMHYYRFLLESVTYTTQAPWSITDAPSIPYMDSDYSIRNVNKITPQTIYHKKREKRSGVIHFGWQMCQRICTGLNQKKPGERMQMPSRFTFQCQNPMWWKKTDLPNMDIVFLHSGSLPQLCSVMSQCFVNIYARSNCSVDNSQCGLFD